MDKQQIKDLISAKIAGQGTNIDAGSALPEILNGILDLLPEPQVQANLWERDPLNPAYIKGILRLVVNDQDLLEIEEVWWDAITSSGIPFVGVVGDSRIFYSYRELTDNQEEAIVSHIQQQTGAGGVGFISFFGHASEVIEDGTTGFAIVRRLGKLYSFFCDI